MVLALANLLAALVYAACALVLLIKGKIRMKNNMDGYEIASPKVLRKLLHLTGTYFFDVVNGRIRISNVMPQLAAPIEVRLWSRADVRDFLDSSIESINSSTSATSSYSMQFRIALTGTDKHWYEMRVSASRYRTKKLLVSGIIVPIDNLKQQEKDAMEMHRRTLNAEERDDFIREMNHAVRTPLNAIVGFSELLADPEMEFTPEEVAEYDEVIGSNAKSLTAILENVLTISHLGSENIFVNQKPLSVPELMRSVLAENAVALNEAGVVVKEIPSDEKCEVRADERMTTRVFNILVDNVMCHAAAGGSLEYGWTCSADGSVQVFVKDKGPGVAENDLPFIYKPFYKADPFSEGAGLGLTVAKGYLDHQDAGIRCESSTEGTSFIVDFKKALPALAFLPFAGFLSLALSILCLAGSIKLYRYVKFHKRFSMMEEDAVNWTLEVSGGHLFKIKDGMLTMGSKTAEFFKFSSSRIPIQTYVESMDDSDKEVARKILGAQPGEVVTDIISLPNFRTFKIMSFSCISMPVKDDDGKYVPMGLFFSIDDEHKRLEAMREVYAKEEESIAKQSFIASMGHEIRNPLNAIVGFSSLLAETYFDIDDEERASYAKTIRENNEHLLSLLDGALLSAKEQDKLLLNSLKETRIADLMEELYKTNSVIIPSHLSFDFEKGGDAYVNVSRTGIRQIVSNLINNACKFTYNGGITFGWNVTRDTVKIYVRDTGIGISAENIENIFKKFYKEDSSTGGAGIGLPLCRRLAEMMGGSLIVDSVVGEGSNFIVSLPRIYPEKQ